MLSLKRVWSTRRASTTGRIPLQYPLVTLLLSKDSYSPHPVSWTVFATALYVSDISGSGSWHLVPASDRLVASLDLRIGQQGELFLVAG